MLHDMLPERDFHPFVEKAFGGSGREPLVVDQHRNGDGCGGTTSATTTRKLKLGMLGCETKEPYGPLRHTALLLIDLIGMAFMKGINLLGSDIRAESQMYSEIVIRMQIFDVQKMEYPQDDEWGQYDGIIIPGSFSAAYDTDAWIERLKQVIQKEIVPSRRKTLGICFGHQIFAHSFSIPITTTNNIGSAVVTPSGPRAGRFYMPLTQAGCSLLVSKSKATNDINPGTISDNDLSNNSVQLYYTHGDMVEKIPDVAISLGGDHAIPLQCIAYFATSHEADQYQNQHVDTTMDHPVPLPYAVTMQAHPEYSISIEMGIHRTLFQCMDAMERRQRPNSDIRSRDDAIQSFPSVQNDSIVLIARIGRIFGWF